MSKKNLDKLFQEKFKDFHKAPDPKVWQSIEASLKEKEKNRRIIPIWWKLGGAAAIITLALFIINPLGNKQNIPSTIVTETEKPTKEEKTITKEKSIQIKEKINASEQITDVNNEKILEEKNTTTRLPQNIITTNKKNNASSVTSSSKVSGSSYAKNTSKNTVITKESTNTNISSTTIANNANNVKLEEHFSENAKNTITQAQEKNIPSKIAKEIEEEEITLVQEDAKKSIYDEIKEQEEEKEDLLAEKTKTNKWSAGANVAPVYFNAIGDGSPVDAMFTSNSKSGNTNLSYGLSIAYEVNKKLSIRSGVHKVDYSYNTNDILFSSNFNSSTNKISTINYNNSSSNLEVISTDTNLNVSSNAPKQETALDASAKNPAKEGVMSQQFGYIEVPVELNYSIIDSKFGVNFIGGLSSLFLIDNSIFLSSDAITTELGEANNINSVNFSTNIGIGLNYKFTPKVKLNVEPMFKYQLNTFSNTQGDFNPYSIGVYSGLLFKF